MSNDKKNPFAAITDRWSSKAFYSICLCVLCLLLLLVCRVRQ